MQIVCDAVLFDLDGTLWDGTETVLRSWNHILAENPVRGPITRGELQSIFGLQLDAIGERFFPALPVEKRYELMRACTAYENTLIRKEGGCLYEGIEEMLRALSRRFPLFVVSNCQQGYIEAVLGHYGFEKYFADTECAGATGLPKSGNIRLVAERNGLKRPVYVGDTETDEAAAAKAGVPFIHAAYGFGTAREGAVSVRRPLELEELLCPGA
jgi:phosphoglycolate phosphatase